MMCPKCGRDIESQITRCPDCGVELDIQYTPIAMTGGRAGSSLIPTRFLQKTVSVGSFKRSAGWWIGAAVLGAIMLAAVAFAIFSRFMAL